MRVTAYGLSRDVCSRVELLILLDQIQAREQASRDALPQLIAPKQEAPQLARLRIQR